MLLFEHPPLLRLRDGKENIVLARGESHYFFIEVNENLNHEAEQMLAEFGADDETLKTLRLSFTAVPIGQIRGIAVESTYRGGAIYLYMKSGKRKPYTLFDSCEEETIDAVFPDMERFTPPKNPGKHMAKEDRWRADRQDKRTYTILAWVNGILTIAGGLSAILYAGSDHWGFLLFCICVYIAFAALEIFLPAYFTVIPRKSGSRKKRASVIDLTIGITLITFFLFMAGGYDYLFRGKTYLYALGLAMVVSLLFRYLAEEFRRDKDAIAIVFAYMILLGVILAGNINIAFDFSEPEAVYTLPVYDLNISHSSRSPNRYYCDVILPDGEELHIQIGSALYRSLEVGDPIRVELNEGLLGIEYTQVFAIE